MAVITHLSNPLLHNKFEVSLGYGRSCFQNQTKQNVVVAGFTPTVIELDGLCMSIGAPDSPPHFLLSLSF